jgi:hypothetical protein
MKSKVRSIVTNSHHFRCPVCARVEPLYNSIVFCGLNGRDRTICMDCALLITHAMEQLRKDGG